MKAKKHRSRNVPNPVARGFGTGYEPSFKRTVILYAEQKSNQEARKRFGISEETIRRWRKLRKDIMEKAQQSIRRSQRHTVGHGSFSESCPPLSPPKKDKEKEKEKSIEKEKVSREEKEIESDDVYLDSMPLQQRLSQNHNEPPPPVHQPQETVLQSQPISPTKLKVTRQGKPQAPPPRVSTPPPPPPPPEVCLKWDSQHTNMQSAFPSLLTKEQYVDATLVSEGKTLKCHRMILSSCSPYFEDVLSGIGPLQHPVLFMKDVPFWILKALCDFMYAGEVHILQDKLQEFLKVASTLKIKGLTDPPSAIEDSSKPVIPPIKKEIEATPPPPPQIPEKPLKEEKEDEPPPPPPKQIKLEIAKPSKKKEDKKSKHSSHTPKEKEKEKEKVVEEPPSPKVAPKAQPKIVTKVVLPKVPPPPKAPVRNVVRNVVKPIPKPSTSKTSHNLRKSETSRRSDKHKVEVTTQKEKEKVVGSQKEKQEKEKPPLKKDNINDPLDLLRPVYEEIAKEPPQVPKSVSPGKLKERGNVPVKKTVNKKVKKRRYAEYAEDREESPPPVFLSRKGTRSRPNVKIPKFFHTHFDDSQKETTDATIVREPHTDQNDPLIGAEMEEIKAEPLDVEENSIVMEANIVSVNYMVQDQEMISQEGEEIIGNYDSPLVNIKREPKSNTPNIFKKEIEDQPVIMDVHTVTEADESLLNIKQENLEIVGIAKVDPGTDRLEETIIGSNFDTLHSSLEKPSEIIISNVQSMAGVPEERHLKEKSESVEHPEEILPTLPDRDIALPKFQDSQAGNCHPHMDVQESSHEPEDGPVAEFPKSFVSVGDRCLESTEISSARTYEEVDQASSNVSKETGDNLPLSETDPLASIVIQSHEVSKEDGLNKCQELMETDEASTDNHMETDKEQSSEIISGSLGSLEERIEALGVESQGSVRIDSRDSGVYDGSLEQKVESFGLSSEELVKANNIPFGVTRGSLGESQSDAPEIIDNTATEPSRTELVTIEHCAEVSRSDQSVDVGPTSSSEQSECEKFQIPDLKFAPSTQEIAVNLSEHRESLLRTPEQGLPVENFTEDTSNSNTSHGQTENSETCNKLNISQPESECDQNLDTTKEENSLAMDTVTLSSAQNASSIMQREEVSEASEESASKTSENAAGEIDCAAVTEEKFQDTSSQEIKQAVEQEMMPSTESSDAVTSIEDGGNLPPEEVLTTQQMGCSDENVAPEVGHGCSTDHKVGLPEKSSEEVIPDISRPVSLIEGIGSSPDVCSREMEKPVDSETSLICDAGSDKQIEAVHLEAKNNQQDVILDDNIGYEQSVENVTTTCQSKDAPASHITKLSVTDGTTQDKEFTENIEAELEECLASTSNVVSLRSSEGRFKVNVKPLPFEDDEEFSSFIGGNRPTNYLGDDFGTDFELNQLDDLKHDTKTDSKEHCHKSDGPVMASVTSSDDEHQVMYASRPETQVDETYKSESEGQNQCHQPDEGVSSDSKIIVEENVEELTNDDVEMNEAHVVDTDDKLGSHNVESKSVVDDQQESVTSQAFEIAISGAVTDTATEEHSIMASSESQNLSSEERREEDTCSVKTYQTTEHVQILHPCNEMAPSGINCYEEPTSVQRERRLSVSQPAFVGCETLESNSEEQSACVEQERIIDSNLEQPAVVQVSHEEELASVSDEKNIHFNLGEHSASDRNETAVDFSLATTSVEDLKVNCNPVEKIHCDPAQKCSPERIGLYPIEQSISFGVENDCNLTEKSAKVLGEQSNSSVVERITELNPTGSPISAEDEKRMEETLLADLDDDIEMKDVTASEEQGGSEKTLEMIVNDLNESLGDMTN